ncbi:alpha/beta hydrolase [Aquimarina sp. MMG016]|uniref:alpha/beta hydrolase n=1 Tax=Aquimarina sp. MMG016 TaxID=2822690 RepID=UPI001B3A25C7|nr:alpha/beta hydrolase [Aquimarina sp. MMG016]MBQ4820297.1 alpha/beta fold hydrolase [Aquimarina sp. MMG016]
MKKPILTLLLFSFLSLTILYAQNEIEIKTDNLILHGTLINPNNNAKTIVLFISGSGNTDRNGNSYAGNQEYVNNSLKMLAEALSDNGIASLRYDKRGVGKSRNESFTERDLRFGHFVNDAISCINYLQKEFDQILIAGHSQGALVGILAAQKAKIHKFISLAGLSDSGYNTIKRQLSNQPEFVTGAAFPILDSIKNGKKVDSIPQFLNTIFRPQIQDYLISFINQNPQKELNKLDIPILVVQGTTDLQITVDEAKKMADANKKSKLLIIEKMNHILKKAEADPNKNLLTYNNPELPLHENLLKPILEFIKE